MLLFAREMLQDAEAQLLMVKTKPARKLLKALAISLSSWKPAGDSSTLAARVAGSKGESAVTEEYGTCIEAVRKASGTWEGVKSATTAAAAVARAWHVAPEGEIS